jgi:hypothetical protein
MENLKLENFNQNVSLASKRCGFERKVIVLGKIKKPLKRGLLVF